MLIFLLIQLHYPKNVTLEVEERQLSIISFQQFLAISPGYCWQPVGKKINFNPDFICYRGG
ncbi:MAG: hypothetical protein DWQ51_15640 [Microcystis wesenbergii TW10]|uniref:Uncharacterized protein n=2 Tax=Microcystis TaxID=1125 RepID=A0A552AE63_MICAE|nr:MAG: hypothetical protein DWQ51_15640 [Microcystis wesenbergii TW10]TRT83746.1 MAG: hypothetical protein EWV63_16840 [Microcystis aeruginosa Ma_OC_H_19870700_S124]